MRHSSAPSLVSPLPPETLGSNAPHQLAPLATSSAGSSSSSISSTSGVMTQLSKKEQAKHSSFESKPKRLMMLQESSLSQDKLSGKVKSTRTMSDHRQAPLHPIDHTPPSLTQKKPTLLVQWNIFTADFTLCKLSQNYVLINSNDCSSFHWSIKAWRHNIHGKLKIGFRWTMDQGFAKHYYDCILYNRSNSVWHSTIIIARKQSTENSTQKLI